MDASNDVSYVKQRPLEDREIKSRQRGMRDLNVCSSELLFLARSNYINRGLNHCVRGMAGLRLGHYVCSSKSGSVARCSELSGDGLHQIRSF